MKEKEKAAPVDQTESGKGGQLSLGGVRLPDNKHITDEDNPQVISEFLSRGEENAVPLQNLVRITGLDQRRIRRMIRAERLQGTPILSNNLSGYFLPMNEVERQQCVRSMMHRSAEIQKVARAIAQAEVPDGC